VLRKPVSEGARVTADSSRPELASHEAAR
jgi:hypothetical protein